jgi:hypothetical protein
MVGKALAFITVTALLFASASFAPDQARCAYTCKKWETYFTTQSGVKKKCVKQVKVCELP